MTPEIRQRRLIVLIAAIVAIVVTYGQLWLGIGQSEEQLAADGDRTLEVAGYAFSIWGPIYVGLLIYAVRQFRERTPETRVLARLGWPSAMTFFGLALWVVASASDWKWATVALIFAQWLVLLAPMLAISGKIRALPARHPDRMMAVWPLAALVGWLTAAAPLNLVTVLTATDSPPASPDATTLAIFVLIAITAVALFVMWRLRTWAYSAPVVWALAGAYVAETERNMPVANAALIGAGLLFAFSLLMLFARGSTHAAVQR